MNQISAIAKTSGRPEITLNQLTQIIEMDLKEAVTKLINIKVAGKDS